MSEPPGMLSKLIKSPWSLSTARIVSNNLSGVNGFGKHAWKPASIIMDALYPCIRQAAIATTGTLPPASIKILIGLPYGE